MAGVLWTHGDKLAGGGAAGDVSHQRGLGIIQHGDAGGGEALHGTHTHTGGDNGVDAGVCQDTDGPHAAALLVRGVVDDLGTGDLAILDGDDGEAVGVAKVAGALGLKAAFAKGGDCELHVRTAFHAGCYADSPMVTLILLLIPVLCGIT